MFNKRTSDCAIRLLEYVQEAHPVPVSDLQNLFMTEIKLLLLDCCFWATLAGFAIGGVVGLVCTMSATWAVLGQ